MLFSEARRHKVMDTTTAQQVAEVDGFVVDPAAGRITALRLGKSKGPGRVLDWEGVGAFGPDAVTVSGTGAIREPADDDEARAAGLDLPGRRVLTERGRELGAVADVEFDPATGAVTAVLVGQTTVAGDRLIGLGSYALVVKEDAG